MDYQLWRIYWAFRNGDSDLATELLAMDANNQVDTIIKGFYGDTLLHLACQNGWLDYVQFLVKELGCDSEVKDWGNQTPLHYACRYGRLDVVQYLTEVHNCDLAMATRDHWTPLHYACRYGHSNIVEYILNIPSVMNRKQLTHVACEYNPSGYFQKLICLIDKQSNPAIVLLQIACSFGQVQVVEYLCDKRGSHWHPNDDTERRRLFIFCCKYGLLQILTELGSSVLNHVDTQGRSGLHYACQNSHINLAKYFIDSGCDINKVDINSYTPLQLACQYSNNIDIVKYMLDNLKCTQAWVEALNTMFSKHQWSDSQCIDLIKLLISTKEWLPNSRCNSNEDTLLHLSARYHRSKIAHFLLSEINCEPNELNEDGATPLDLATDVEIISLLVGNKKVQSKPGNAIVERMLTHLTGENDSLCIDVLKALIDLGQWNPNLSHNSDGDTALHLTLRHHRPVLAHFLLSEVKCDPTVKNLKNEVPIQLIIQFCSDSECIDLIKKIIATKHWDPDFIYNSEGDTALHLSAWYHRQELTHFLVFEAGSFLSVKNKGGETPLSLLLSTSQWTDSDCIQLMKCLLTSKCWDPNSACDSEGNTVLHLAALYHRPEVTKFMISKTICNPNKKNLDKKTPLDLATDVEVISLLISSERVQSKLSNAIIIVYRVLIHSTVEQDSLCIDILKTLIDGGQYDPTTSFHPNGDTALHLSMLLNRPVLVNFLLSESNARNPKVEIPIQLIIQCISDPECTDLIKQIIAMKRWDANSICNSKGDTALHLSVLYYRPDLTNFLVLEAGCHLSVRNKQGKTPLYLMLVVPKWKDSDCISFIQDLVNTKNWNPDSQSDSKGNTVLHLAVLNCRPQVTEFMISETLCDLNIKNIEGETFVTLLMMPACRWKDSECTMIIRVLMETNKWDPNSSCNSKDDTALHLSVRYHRPRVLKLLLSEAECDPNVINNKGETLVELLMSYSSWHCSECVNIIKALLATRQWDPNSSCNLEHDTALHLSAMYHRPIVARFLLSEMNCNPNIKNRNGATPLDLATDFEIIHLLINNERVQVIPGNAIIKTVLTCATDKHDTICIDIVKTLIEAGQWNPNLSHNFSNDNRALHLAVKYHKPRIVDFLLCEANLKCNAFMKNRKGETPMALLISGQLWNNSECAKTIRLLMSTDEWDPNLSCNFKGDTVLHLAVRHYRPELMKFLLYEAKCDPNIKNKKEETPIELLLTGTNKNTWLDSECIEIIRALVATRYWDPNSSCNSIGDTALHLSVRNSKPRLVHFLLSETKCDPNSRNSNNETALQLATDTDIINDLICHGSNPDNVYKLYGKSVRLKKPLKPPIKVFIIGNSGVGKSTLTEALKKEVPLLIKAFATRRRVGGVDEKTAGIVPHDFVSKTYGHVTFYDFAGHREFYSSHAAFLHNVIQGSSPIFLLVVDMSATIDIIQQNILYWLSFIENQCSVVKCTSHVIVIGSHADVVLSRGDNPQQNAMEISESLKTIFHSSILENVGVYPMDCQYPESPGMTRLRNCLTEICNAVRIPKVIPFNAHCFHVFLLDKFRANVAVTVQEIRDQIIKEQNIKEGIARFLPETSTTIYKVCDELNNRGHILFLRNASKELSRVPLQIQDDENDRDDTPNTNNDDSEVPICTQHATIPTDISKNVDDKSLQELPDYDESGVSLLPTYETATSLHKVKHSVPAGLSSTADNLQDDAMDNKSLQVLPGCDETDEDKAAAALPTYETASKSNTTNLKTKGHCGIDEGDNDTRRKTLLGNYLCASAAPKLHQLDCLEGNGKKVKLIDATAAVWDKVAIRLHFEGRDIARIDRDHPLQSVLSVTTVFIEWLDGTGRQPASWAVLIDALKETELFTDDINDLECILGISDDFIAHDEPQEAVVSYPCTSSVLSQPQSLPTQCNGNNSFVSTATKPKFNGAKGDSEGVQMKLKRKSDLPQPDHKPKLLELQVLKDHDGRKVKVIEGVGDRWKELAKSLDFDGCRIDIIDVEVPHEQPEEACQQMLIEWLDEDDDLRGPVTWATLIQSLIDAGLVDIADRLKEFVNS